MEKKIHAWENRPNKKTISTISINNLNPDNGEWLKQSYAKKKDVFCLAFDPIHCQCLDILICTHHNCKSYFFNSSSRHFTQSPINSYPSRTLRSSMFSITIFSCLYIAPLFIVLCFFLLYPLLLLLLLLFFAWTFFALIAINFVMRKASRATMIRLLMATIRNEEEMIGELKVYGAFLEDSYNVHGNFKIDLWKPAHSPRNTETLFFLY